MLKRLRISVMVLLALCCITAKGNNQTQTVENSDSITANQKSDQLISRNIFVEFGGPSFSIGIGYDQRFRPNSVFGFRAGLSYTSVSWDDAGWFGAYEESYTSAYSKGVTFPLEVNAIMGKRASKFELGIGATPGILHRHEIKYLPWQPEDYHRLLPEPYYRLYYRYNISYGF